MPTLNELQQRLAVASERNRLNNERRTQLLAEIKEKFGCDSLDDLKKFVADKEAEVAKLTAEADAAKARAEAAVSAVELAVGVRS